MQRTLYNRVNSQRREITRLRRNAFGCSLYRGADKSLARPGMKQATATEDSDVHISYL